MSKTKSISRYLTTYNRANVYDNSIVENKHQLSYIEMDFQGNVIEDKIFDEDGNLENHIQRTFYENNKVKSESFMDVFSDEPYEIRQYSYNEDGLLASVKVKYPEDEIKELYSYSPQGKLLEKKVVYSNSYNYIEKEYVWEGDNLLKVIEKDEDDLVNTQNMSYNQDGNIIELEVLEHLNNNKQSERYQYENNQVIRQEILNYKGDIMTIVKSQYEGELLLERTIESGSQFFKHCYKYDEKEHKIQESILNRDDLVLTDYITKYDDGLEINIKKYSLNIVDDEKELILIEETSFEYSFFD